MPDHEVSFKDAATFAAILFSKLNGAGWTVVPVELLEEIGRSKGPTLLGDEAWSLSEGLREALDVWLKRR